MNKHNRNRYREQTSGYHWEEGSGRGKMEMMGLRSTNNHM